MHEEVHCGKQTPRPTGRQVVPFFKFIFLVKAQHQHSSGQPSIHVWFSNGSNTNQEEQGVCLFVRDRERKREREHAEHLCAHMLVCQAPHCKLYIDCLLTTKSSLDVLTFTLELDVLFVYIEVKLGNGKFTIHYLTQ